MYIFKLVVMYAYASNVYHFPSIVDYSDGCIPLLHLYAVCVHPHGDLCDCKQALKFIWANWFLIVIISFDSELCSHLQYVWAFPCSHILFISFSGLPLALSLSFLFFSPFFCTEKHPVKLKCIILLLEKHSDNKINRSTSDLFLNNVCTLM